jgi:hypothetical protein
MKTDDPQTYKGCVIELVNKRCQFQGVFQVVDTSHRWRLCGTVPYPIPFVKGRTPLTDLRWEPITNTRYTIFFRSDDARFAIDEAPPLPQLESPCNSAPA